ncbi:type II secretion system protein GspM [Pseudidiomarina sediminum]|uniref:type II secretion system protein GspM n=1 Tax=Pseudidiomarina sediminum TaxID=431675 RepID=UPI001C978D5F|nr:type II secretion system protein M [Pseudidiomarina sediminum]MBY6063761.1 type II secretion system protein M [Pseudidiomarina sediminum]
MLEQMKQRWQQLNRREHVLVMIAGVVLAVSILYFALWNPLQNGIEQRQLQRDAQVETLQWVRENTGRYQALVKQGQTGTSTGAAKTHQLGDIPRLVTLHATKLSLDVGAMNPEGEALVVVLSDVPFNQVLALIDALQQQESLVVQQLDVTKASKPGYVHVRRLKVGLS